MSSQQQQQQQQQSASTSYFDFAPQFPKEEFGNAPDARDAGGSYTSDPNQGHELGFSSEREGIGGGGGGSGGSAGSLNGREGGDSPVQRFSNPIFDLESQQQQLQPPGGLVGADSPESSPVKSFSQPVQQPSPVTRFSQPPQHPSPTHHFSKPVLPPPAQPLPGNQSQSSPVHSFAHPGTGQRTTSYGSSSSQDPTGKQNHSSPVHNFSKPVPIAPPPQQQQRDASPVVSFGQVLSSSSSSLPYPNQLSHFPMPLAPPTPAAAPNQTPAFNQSQSYPPPPLSVTSTSSQPLYSNHREAQPAQHTPPTLPKNENFPAGWLDPVPPPPPGPSQSESMRSLQEGSIVESRDSRPTYQAGNSSVPNRRNPSLNRGINQEHGAYDAGVIQRPTPPGQPLSINPTVGLPSQPQQGGSYSSSSFESGKERERQQDREQREREQHEREQREREQHEREQREREQREREQREREQREREQMEREREREVRERELRERERDRQWEREQDREREQPAYIHPSHNQPQQQQQQPQQPQLQQSQQQQQQRPQPASPPYIKGTFNYHQHLQRQVLSGSTSPRGRLAYQPPPLPASVLQQQPKNTSPLSVRERELFNKPQSGTNSSINTPHHAGSSPASQQQYGSQSTTPQGMSQGPQIGQERKTSFGASQGVSPTSVGYRNTNPSSSPHNTQSPPQDYSGSPHGSATSSTRPARVVPYSPPQVAQQSPPGPPRDNRERERQQEQEKDRKRQQEQEREWEREQQREQLREQERSRDLPPINTQHRDNYHHPRPLLTPIPDGPAPPPAPSCPPPDTPGSEFGPPFPKGYRSFIGLGLMGKKLNDAREYGESGTPTGFLGRRGHSKKNSDERGGPIPLGKRTRGVGSGPGKGERPGSAEEDDPIPTEYRPQKRIDEDVNEGDNEGKREEGKKGLALGFPPITGPPTQQAIATAPPTHPQSGISPKAQPGYGRPPLQHNPSQRSPAEVGLGGYLYTKPVPTQQSPGNLANPNPRFPGTNINHHVTSPLSGGGGAGSATSPGSNNGGSTRESVMRGQWADTTAAVARPVQQERLEDRGQQQQPGWFEGGQLRISSGGSQPSIPQGPPTGPTPPPHQQQYQAHQQQQEYGSGESGAFKVFTQNLQKPLLSQQQQQQQQGQPQNQQQQRRVQIHSPPNFIDVQDNDDQGTNPSESPTPEIPILGHKPPRSGSEEEVLFHSLEDLLPALPSTHLQSLLAFALYLCDDAIVVEKAKKVRLTGTGDLGNQLVAIRDKRLRRWKEWVSAEETERSRQVGLSLGHFRKKESRDLNPFEHDSSDDDNGEDAGLGYEGMQPLPPPPRLPEIEGLDLKAAGMDAFGGRQHGYQNHGHYDAARSPSPTPTIDQVANAPKVDLELQMPRPVPSVPAIRIDPSARRRLYDDDASTVVSEAQSKGGDNEQIGQPGVTPFAAGFRRSDGGDYGSMDIRPVDTKSLMAIISIFNRGSSVAGVDGSGVDQPSTADIPPFLHMAYAALDTAVNNPSLETYLSDARRALENATSQRLHQFNNESHQRRQRIQLHTAQLYNTGRFTFAGVERMRDEFEQEEARRKMEVDMEIYHIFENEYVEVAYKEVKGQLEILGGKWYEEVKLWLFNESSSSSTSEGTALKYHLLLEAIDLLNKLHITMEEHEHVLQSLVSDRNARYLQVSVQPLLSVGETARAADAERRFWMDESERQLRGKMEAVKRGKEHEKSVERVVGELVKGLRGRFRGVVEGVYAVVFQFPPGVLPQLFRRFFDDNAGSGNVGSTALPQEHTGSPSSSYFIIPKDVMQAMVDAIQTLGEIVGLIKLAMDFQNAPQIRVCEATTALEVAEEHAHNSGVMAPTATADACSQGLAIRLPAALKRVREEQIEQGERAMGEMMEALRKLQNFLTTVRAEGGRVGFMGVAPPPMVQSQSQQSQQSQQHTPQQQQHTPQQMQQHGQQLPMLPVLQPPMVQVGQNWSGEMGGGGGVMGNTGGGEWGYGRGGGLGAGIGGGPQPGQGRHVPSLSTMIGNFRAGQLRPGNTNSLLISPGGYSPSGYSPGGASVWNSP